MASGFFVILDDIAAIFDDVAAMSKLATKKTAGVLGDDLAVNAEKASGFHASRELPVLWAITKGSFLNKLIILPFAFLLSAFAPWSIVPILLIGGSYLCYEGFEKIFDYSYKKFTPPATTTEPTLTPKTVDPTVESAKIKSAILTDFILSVEIIIIALGAVANQTMLIQIIAVSFVALLATVGVYGLVALLIRLDDNGLKLIVLSDNSTGFQQKLLYSSGQLLVAALPKIIKTLSVVGTIAMLLVGGGIFVHNIHSIDYYLAFMPSLAAELLTGFIVGLIAFSLSKLCIRH